MHKNYFWLTTIWTQWKKTIYFYRHSAGVREKRFLENFPPEIVKIMMLDRIDVAQCDCSISNSNATISLSGQVAGYSFIIVASRCDGCSGVDMAVWDSWRFQLQRKAATEQPAWLQNPRSKILENNWKCFKGQKSLTAEHNANILNLYQT